LHQVDCKCLNSAQARIDQNEKKRKEKKILNKGGAKTGVSYGEYVPHGNLPRVPKHMETVEYSIYFKSQPQG
jgi:hypothetical protein